MKIAVAKSKTSKNWRTINITWEELLDKLRSAYRTPETEREYRTMSRDKRDTAKGAMGGFVGGALSSGQRKTQFVTERSLITLDADEAVPGAWDQATLLVENRMACYSTHSHTKENPRLRWVIPTNRPMTPSEYPAVARMVATWLNIETMDPTTYEVARLMYWPTCAIDGEYEFHEQEGPLLDVDHVLSLYGYNNAWEDSALWPIAKSEQEVRTHAMKVAGDPTTKPGIVGLFCRAYDVPAAIDAFLSDVYEQTAHEDRYTYINGSTAAGAIVYNDGAFLYSNHGTDPAGGGQCCNAFDLVRIHKFGHLDNDVDPGTPVTKLPSYSAMAKFAGEDPVVGELQIAEKMEQVQEDFKDLESEVEEEPEKEGPPDGKDWTKKLKRVEKTGEIEETLNNAMLLIRNLPDFCNKLGYNPMTDSITVIGDLPWRERKRKLNDQKRGKISLEDVFSEDDMEPAAAPNADWTSSDWPDFYAYMETWGFMTGKSKSNGMLENALLSVAQEHTYHPIKSYLEELEWDGVERLDTMFIRWLGAEDDELNRLITRLWMIAAVDRIVRPGAQFDEILITCGPQGIGKSKLLRYLARGFFTNSISALNMSKQTAELLQGMWVVELGELDGMRKGEQTAIKNFITATTDRYRGAYAREAKNHPRQCVLAGTSNEGSFLRDSTGERRYWIMPVKGKGDRGELRGFQAEVDQLWAEAVVRWKERMKAMREPGQTVENVNLYLYLRDDAMEAEMETRRQGFKLPEMDRVDIIGYLDTPRPDNWYDLTPWDRKNFAQGDYPCDESTLTLKVNSVCLKEIRYELFNGREDRDFRIGDIMNSVPGWKKVKPRRHKAYANWPLPTWVRIGSEEDY